MADLARKKAVDKAVRIGELKLAAELLNELYPPMEPDAYELIHGIDEATWVETDDEFE